MTLQRQASFHLVTIFLEIRELPQECWEQQIAAYCGSDQALAEQVRGLLQDDLLGAELCPGPNTLVGGRYHLERELGAGGSGAVYCARDTKIPDRRVALKMLHSRRDGDGGLLRAWREASAASQVVNDHVVRVEDVGLCEEAGAYLVMELCAEPVAGVLTYARSMSDSRPTGLREVVRWSLQVARGVHALHEQGVFHLDLKPDNVLIRPQSRRAQVVDFGLAVHGSPSRGSGTEGASTVGKGGPESSGRPGRYLGPQGTLCFMAPEQARGLRRDLDPEVGKDFDVLTRVDVYGAGAILYYLLAGQPPFVDLAQDLCPAELLRLMRTRTPTPLRGLRRHPPQFRIPARLARIVERAMAQDSSRRYASCAELADDLQRYLAYKPTSLEPKRSPTGALLWAVRNKSFLFPVMALAILLAALAGQARTALQLQSAQALSAQAQADVARLEAESEAQRASQAKQSVEQRARVRVAEAQQRLATTQTRLRRERGQRQDVQREAQQLRRQLAQRRATVRAGPAPQLPGQDPDGSGSADVVEPQSPGKPPAELQAADEPPFPRPSTGKPSPDTPAALAALRPTRPVPDAEPATSARGRGLGAAGPVEQEPAPGVLHKPRGAAPNAIADTLGAFVREVRRAPEQAWEVRASTARGRLVGLCTPAKNGRAVRCKDLSLFSRAQRAALVRAMRAHGSSERLLLVRDRNGNYTEQCSRRAAVTGSHFAPTRCTPFRR